MVCVVDILYSCKQGRLLAQAAFASERKAKEEAHTARDAAEDAAARDKVGIQIICLASFANIVSSCFSCLQYS